MTVERHPAGTAPPRADLIGRIEGQTAFLNRNFELLHRRSETHSEMDRSEYLMLRTLGSAPEPPDINALAAMLGLSPSTAGRQVAALRRKGFATTTPDPADRRRSLITPTETGRALAAETRRRRQEGFADLLADWDEEDLRLLGEMFRKYNAAVARKHLTREP
ncbi:MarR family winged helix-turn-helix transcriptional regulator [Streptomyces sp. SPB074]|uniref:MarR family winged helix-turn-helix transcriptional regulator n=1 Tax=Streptomyces sp. (strain SPB074) TaxID=465543 RepID=UPI00017F13DF|nr:MarR family transcriptional regulator [Streptomyces sp. SPB074]